MYKLKETKYETRNMKIRLQKQIRKQPNCCFFLNNINPKKLFFSKTNMYFYSKTMYSRLTRRENIKKKKTKKGKGKSKKKKKTKNFRKINTIN